MTITLTLSGIRGHLVRWTLEAHTDIAPCTMDLIAASPPYHRYFTARIGANSNSILFYILFEKNIALDVMARPTWVISSLNID